MYTVGIDIGGTQLRVAILNEGYQIIDVYKTSNDRSLTCEQNMDKLLNFISSRSEQFKGIGIGCPGPLDLKKGAVVNPPNLIGWDGFEIVNYVEMRTGLKVVLNNDANVAGLAEALLGKGCGLQSVVFMGLSTGLGGAYIYDGKLVSGANGNAGEWWNMIVNEDPRHHKNANAGSLNEQAAGSGLQRNATQLFGETILPRELFDLFYQKDELAVKIIEDATEALAKGIANIACVIDPDIFIVGGSIAIYNPIYLEMAVEKAKKYLLLPEALRVEKAMFGDDAGLVGAALLLEYS